MAKKFPKVTFQEVRPKVKIKQDIINFFENELPTLPMGTQLTHDIIYNKYRTFLDTLKYLQLDQVLDYTQYCSPLAWKFRADVFSILKQFHTILQPSVTDPYYEHLCTLDERLRATLYEEFSDEY